MPAVCRKGNLNRTLTGRQTCIDASENMAGRPGLPSCGASHDMSLSSQISNEPRLRGRARKAAILRRPAPGFVTRLVQRLVQNPRTLSGAQDFPKEFNALRDCWLRR